MFEYKFIKIQTDDYAMGEGKSIESILNELGRAGWELVNFHTQGVYFLGILKRSK